jgi:DNA-binding LacI/PurR family transcriptional regulator
LKNEDMALLRAESMPTVFYSSRANEVDHVGVNRSRGICEAIKHLAGLGHRKIGFVGKQGDFEPRYQTYKNLIMGRDELIENPAWTTSGFSSYKIGYEGMKQLLALKDRPSAVVCHCDIVALGALCAAFELGVKVPDKMSIVGFDNICESKFAAVPLTTIEVNIKNLANDLVDVLFKRIENPDSKEPLKVIVEPKLVVRKSTAEFQG